MGTSGLSGQRDKNADGATCDGLAYHTPSHFNYAMETGVKCWPDKLPGRLVDRLTN